MVDTLILCLCYKVIFWSIPCIPFGSDWRALGNLKNKKIDGTRNFEKWLKTINNTTWLNMYMVFDISS